MPRRVPDLTKARSDDRLRAAASARRHPRRRSSSISDESKAALGWTLHWTARILGECEFQVHFCSPPPCLSWAAPAHADVQLRIENGRVSLKATNATVREILAEWARVGQTQIVNGERMPGGPITHRADRRPRGTSARHHPALRGRIHDGAARHRPSSTRRATIASSCMPTSSPTRPTPPPRRRRRRSQQPQFPAAVRRPDRFRRSSRAGSSRRSSRRSSRHAAAGERRRATRTCRTIRRRTSVPPNPARRVFGRHSRAAGAAAAVKPRSADRPAVGTPPAGVSVPGMVVPAPQQPAGSARRSRDQPQRS